MKFLSPERNTNFTIRNNLLYNHNSAFALAYLGDAPRAADQVNPMVNIYLTGALVIREDYDKRSYEFFNNRGIRILDISIDNCEKDETITGRVKEASVLVCSSGLLTSIIDNKENELYQYYLYDGGILKDNDVYGLKRQVQKYEVSRGLFTNAPLEEDLANETVSEITAYNNAYEYFKNQERFERGRIVESLVKNKEEGYEK